MGVFSVAEETMASSITSFVKEKAESAGSWIAQSPRYIKWLPVMGGKDGDTEPVSPEAYLKAFQNVPQVMESQAATDAAKVGKALGLPIFGNSPEGNQLKTIADRGNPAEIKKLEDIASGKIKRLIINMPPRHTKSEFASFLFPAWMIGRNPAMKII